MNANEAKFIGRAQADGENATDKAQPRIPIGSRVSLKNYDWPTGFLVIGHTASGGPIIQSDTCFFADCEIEDFDRPITAPNY